ncbi:MAG: GNAT family N-acetyltransferase [Rhizobiaceae bacterium]
MISDTHDELTFSVSTLGEVEASWRDAGPRLTTATPQDLDFVLGWQKHVNADCIAVVGAAVQTGLVDFVLPLEIIRKNLLTLARFPGGSHANSNFAASGTIAAQMRPERLTAAISKAVSLARPDIDAIMLERQLERLDKITNRLILPQSGTSPNVALSFAFLPTFQELLKVRNGPKKLKKMRQMHRRMEERGGYRQFKAQSRAECQRVLERFFQLKGERLKSRGLNDVFGDEEVQAFFKALFCDAVTLPSPRFELHALEVGGEIAAVAGCSIHGKHVTVEFGGICSTDHQLSPGDILFHFMIEQYFDRGFEIFDFGVGDEFYKRRWCDIETWHRDTFLALSAKGRVATSAMRAVAGAKKSIKSNPMLFNLLKKLRSLRRTEPGKSSDDS